MRWGSVLSLSGAALVLLLQGQPVLSNIEIQPTSIGMWLCVPSCWIGPSLTMLRLAHGGW